jgi:hypothetical protein
VVELVADVRHPRLVDDPAVLGIDDGNEVRLENTGTFVQARHVEKLLGLSASRLLG